MLKPVILAKQASLDSKQAELEKQAWIRVVESGGAGEASGKDLMFKHEERPTHERSKIGRANNKWERDPRDDSAACLLGCLDASSFFGEGQSTFW